MSPTDENSRNLPKKKLILPCIAPIQSQFQLFFQNAFGVPLLYVATSCSRCPPINWTYNAGIGKWTRSYAKVVILKQHSCRRKAPSGHFL
jgi:hypothetical protein